MSLVEIGQRLKSARDNSGLSLSQINERTKIPFNHLEAIEQGNFDDLPEPVYVAGFIKRYADCVGLNGQQAADEYRQELDQLNAKPEKSGFIFKNHKQQSHKNHSAGLQSAYYNRQPIEQAPPNLMKMIPFYALWIIVILALIIYLFNRQESIDLAQQDPGILALKQSTTKVRNVEEPNSAPTVKKVNPDTATVPDEANNSDATSNSAGEQDNSVASGAGSNQVTVLAKRHVWVEVKATSSGEALFTGFMEGGTSHNFNDPEGLRIRAGNAGNVEVTFAGKTEDLGAAGKIAEKTFANHVSKTASGASSAAENQGNKSIAHGVTVSTGNNKKTAEKTAENSSKKKPATVKPLVAAGTKKPGSTGTNAAKAVHKYEGIGGDNKGIDVPYRYND